MDEIEPTPTERRRTVRYGDEEAATTLSPPPMTARTTTFSLPPLQRTKSSGSMSIRSVKSMNRRNSIDPAIALPIQYRSMYVFFI